MPALVSLGYHELRNPVVLIRINGEPAPGIEQRRIRFSYNQKFGKRDECKMTFRDTDRALASGTALQIGDVWEVCFGYFGDLSRPRTLTVKAWKPNFDAGAPQMSITFRVSTGRTSSSRSKQARYGTEPEHTYRPKNWGVVQSSEVAKKIARRHQLSFKGTESEDANKNAPFIQPGNMSDFEYLQQVAFDIDFECFIEDGTLYYRAKPYDEAPRRVLWYHGGESYMLSFVPDVKVTSITIKPRWASSQALRLDKVKWQAQKAFYGGAAALPQSIVRGGVDFVQSAFGLEPPMSEDNPAVKRLPAMSGNVPTGNLQPGSAFEQFAAAVSASAGGVDKILGELDRREAVAGIAAGSGGPSAPTATAGPGAERRFDIQNLLGGNISDVQVGLDDVSTSAGSIQVVAADERLQKLIAAASYKKKVDKAVTATIKVIGSPRFRSRTNIRTEGVTKRYSVKWYIKDSAHVIGEDNSYLATLKVKRGTLTDTVGPKTDKPNGGNDKEAPREPPAGFTIEAFQGALENINIAPRGTSVPAT